MSLIKFDKVSFSPNKGRNILNQLSFAVEEQDFIIVIGGNGSGKTTLLKLINQRYHHSEGNISFANKSIDDYSRQALSREIVTLSQSIKDRLFTGLSIKENATLLNIYKRNNSENPSAYNHRNLADYLKKFNEKLSRSLETPVHLLSGGEQQILAFALYLHHQPSLLLLDEHTSALDPKTADKIMAFTAEAIAQYKISCLMTTHNLDFALNYGNRLIAIKNGEIIYQAKGEEKKQLTKNQLLGYCY